MMKIKSASFILMFVWVFCGVSASQDILLQDSLLQDSLLQASIPQKIGEDSLPRDRHLTDSRLSDRELPDSLFLRANGLYQEGDYESALASYRKVLEAGFESSDLYYNMGNAAFRSNNIGYAILYYEKALKLDPFHEDAFHNLEFVSRYRVDTFEQVPRLFISNWIQKLVSIFPEHTWSILSLLFFVLILASVVVYLFARKLTIKKTGFFSALIGLLLFSIALLSGIAQHRSIIHPDAGIILSPSVVVKSTPSESGTELFILHEGTRVELNERVAGWRNIRVVDGREGWVRSGDFESI